MAKCWVTDACGQMVDECRQLHGGAGCMLEYPIARLHKNVRIHRILAGTNEVMEELIARRMENRMGAARPLNAPINSPEEPNLLSPSTRCCAPARSPTSFACGRKWRRGWRGRPADRHRKGSHLVGQYWPSTAASFNARLIDMKSNVVTVSPKYQVVIPQSVRESAGIKPGAKVMVISLGGVIRLMPVLPAAAYRGIARGVDTTLPSEPDRF